MAWAGVPWVGDRTLLELLRLKYETRRSLQELWSCPPEELRALIGLHPRAVATLEEGAAQLWTRAGRDAEELRAWGVTPLVLGEPPECPAFAASRTRPRRWPVVFAYGAMELLEEPRALIVNSRDAGPDAIALTDALGDGLARRDRALCASSNREAYQAAAVAAKRHAGPAVLALDRGFADVFPEGPVRDPVQAARIWDVALDPDLQLVVSAFPWRQPGAPHNGQRRDALLFDLADVVVAVHIRSGGTMDEECRLAHRRGRTVFAVDRGEATPEAVRSLWEEGVAERLKPSSADALADAVATRMPAEQGSAGERADRLHRRELLRVLPRLCSAAERPGGRRRSVLCSPAGGELAAAASPWMGQDPIVGRVRWVLADLSSHADPGPRLVELIDRLEPEGLLAALIPLQWLESPNDDSARAALMVRASPLILAATPTPARGNLPRQALILLRAGVPGARDAELLTCTRSSATPFQLRRFLQEVVERAAGTLSRV